jgi:1-deoxy-D-xylulose-5-phosphate synthase
MKANRLLNGLSSPHQLRRLSDAELKQLAGELRARIIEVVSKRGGHLASNLGIAELTIALHYVFDFQRDRLVWDVGHQCYAHKILTGRGGRFDTLRQAGGISGFPDPAESDYDLFATGHAGTAISTATGLAWADLAAARDTKIVAVVGDASIVNGLSLEGINNAALLRRQFLIVLNDNSMAIDRTQGAMAGVLDRIRMTQTYSDIKHSAETVLQHLPMGDEITGALKNIKAGLRTTIHGGRVFETLGFSYFGPVDGHNVRDLIRVLQRLSRVNRPALLHVHTQKGRGAQYAVEDPIRFHSTSAYTVREGKAVFETKAHPSWTAVFSDALVELARRDSRIVAITAAMPDGTGLSRFRELFPSRFIDVGINESHAVAMAAGLAKTGLRPVVAVYSTFLQRAFDQVFEELALQKLPVLLCMDRAGLVGSDGAVHQGFADIAMLRTLPNMVLMAPAVAEELKAAMEFALLQDLPAAIRYPRDEAPRLVGEDCPAFELGKARLARDGEDGTFLCYGTTVEPALAAACTMEQEDHLDVAVVSARFAKPLDVSLITRAISTGKPVIACEEHAVACGFGSAVMELAAARGLNASRVRLLGIPDRFILHATRQEQLAEIGLDAANLAATMKDMIRNPAPIATKEYL